MDFDKKDGFSYLDDIPIRIASKFCPPRPVALPLAFEATLPSDLLAEQYDFSLEKQVLEFEQRRAAELEAAREREADRSVASKIESMSNISHGEGVNQTNTVRFDPSVPSNNQNLPSWRTISILQPQLQEQFQSSKTACESKLEDCSKKINLSDFENDTSSPFDYMELQTINDLEELNSVFQDLGSKQSAKSNEQIDDMADSLSLSEGSLARNEIGGVVSKSISFPLPQNAESTYSENSNDTLQYGAAARSVPVPSSINADSRLSFSYPSVPGIVGNISSSNRTVDLRNYPGANLSYSALSQVPYVSSHTARHSITATLDSEQISASKTVLRGSKSFSDLHNLTESGSDNVSKQERSCTPPSSVTASEVTETLIKQVFVNNAHSRGSSEDNTSSNGGFNCDSNIVTENAYGLPDPYYELDENAKQTVNSITDMGFHRGQVARTVKHLGMDQKKVVEHLCQIQMLEESGYDSLEAEAALHLHDYNKDQAKTFLDLVNQFQDLGFEKNAVKKALVQNKNDWNKTIDALLP